MPYSRPSLVALRNGALQDVQGSGVPGIDLQLRFGVLPTLSWAIAGLAYEHYGYQDWIALNSVPWTAQGEYAYGWGALKGVTPVAATAASGTVTFSGVSGTDCPQGTTIVRSDGTTYASSADAVVNTSGVLTVPVTCTVAGVAGQANANATFYISPSITGIGNTSTGASAMTGGAETETDTAFRTRMLQVWANPPQGGAATDYVQWALEVPGVTRAWCQPLGAGAGTVLVYVMFDQSEAANGGFPIGTNGTSQYEKRGTAVATGDQLHVADFIYPLRPVTALVYVAAPSKQPINYTISGLVPNTTPVQAEIAAALAAMHLAKQSPGGIIYPSDWNTAIASASGVQHFTVSSPVAPVTAAAGALLTVGTITYAA